MNALVEKLQRSWKLFNRSLRVVRDHPKLLVFPIFTGLLTLAIALFFLAPVALVMVVPHWVDESRIQAIADTFGFLRFTKTGGVNFQVQPLGTVFLAVMYLLNMFLATMGSVAFNSEILEALADRPVSIRHGISVACQRWKAVLFWSLLAGVVGLIIRALEQRFSFIGRLVAGLIGLAWSVASIFAIPILVRETSLSSPFAVLTKSATTIKRTWGEMLAGYVGMQGTNILVLWLSILIWAVTGFAAYLLSNPWLLLINGVVWLLGLITYSYIASVASRVYLCALYLYAAEGLVAVQYEASMMDQAWRRKRGSG